MNPTHDQIVTHQIAHGGLWRAIPKRTEEGQPRPILACLGINGNRLTIEGGDLAATIAENKNLQGAEWAPVDSKGDRI